MRAFFQKPAVRLPFFNETLAAAGAPAAYQALSVRESCVVSAESVTSILVLLIGFAVAGALASGYQLLTARPASFNIFGDGTRPAAVAQVPFLVFAAPFIIMRNTLMGCRIERGNFVPAMIATVLAGFWSLMSGTVVVMALQALRPLFL